MTDPFLHDDAAYVLGALDDADRIAFEAHLVTCADCRARVAELRGTADLLAALPRTALVGATAGPVPGGEPEAVEPVPDTLLPGLLRRAARERRRRQVLTASIGTVAAACVLALAIVLWPGAGSSSSNRPPAQALSAVQPNPLKVTARLTAKAWGTQIDLHCSYPSYEHERFAYDLVVIDRAQKAHPAGDWTLVPGKDGIDFTAGTSVPRADIQRLQVRTAGGTPLLELRL